MKKLFSAIAIISIPLLATISPSITANVETQISDHEKEINGVTYIYDGNHSSLTQTGLEFSDQYREFYEIVTFVDAAEAQFDYQLIGAIAPETAITVNDLTFSVQYTVYVNGNTVADQKTGRTLYAIKDSNDNYVVSSDSSDESIGFSISDSTFSAVTFTSDNEYKIVIESAPENSYNVGNSWTTWATINFETPVNNYYIAYDSATNLLINDIADEATKSQAGLITFVVILSITSAVGIGYIGYIYYNKNKHKFTFNKNKNSTKIEENKSE